MSLFRPVERRHDGLIAPPSGFRSDRPRGSALRVTPDTALKHSAVAACVGLLCNIATWPVHSYRRTAGVGMRLPESDQPQFLRRPSIEATPIEWRREILWSWATRGNAFGMITSRDALGYPRTIELLHPDSVTVRSTRSSGISTWEFLIDNKPFDRYPNGDLWHTRGLWTKPGVPVGISPIEMALAAIGLGIAAEDFGSSWFYDGAHPSAVLYTDQQVTKDQARTIKDRFVDAVTGASGRREPAVLGAGVKYQQVQVAANESQFLETLDRNIATVARYFLVAPEYIGGSSGASMTYSNIETRGLAMLQQFFGPWLSKLEESFGNLTPGGQYVKINVDSLLRVDAKTRHDIHQISITNRIRSRDEVRALEDLPPYDGEDPAMALAPASKEIPK